MRAAVRATGAQRWCSWCRRWKPASAFTAVDVKLGRPWCHSCRLVYRREYSQRPRVIARRIRKELLASGDFTADALSEDDVLAVLERWQWRCAVTGDAPRTRLVLVPWSRDVPPSVDTLVCMRRTVSITYQRGRIALTNVAVEQIVRLATSGLPVPIPIPIPTPTAANKDSAALTPDSLALSASSRWGLRMDNGSDAGVAVVASATFGPLVPYSDSGGDSGTEEEEEGDAVPCVVCKTTFTRYGGICAVCTARARAAVH